MLENILRTTEKFIPKKVYRFFQPAYHFLLALAGAFIYRFPSRHLIIIGVTGTKGKSSTTEILNHILETAGYRTALSNTIRFKIDKNSTPNMYKMSMPGRMFMQRFLRKAVDAGCTHAVIEMTSEGSKQLRSLFINSDALIFLNLSPEHIESHGSYEKYVLAKVDIAKQLEHGTWRTLWDCFGTLHKKTVIIPNADDAETVRFLKIKADEKIPYYIADAAPYRVGKNGGISFTFKDTPITSPLRGLFNIYNALAAATASHHFGVPLETIALSLRTFSDIKGRVEKIEINQPFEVIVDYAHTADSLEKLYVAFPQQKKVCILGSTGGGRDTWKRPEMGAVADTYCDHIILTNEDPYDEDPLKIIEDVKKGITKKNPEIILDRREAINKALSLVLQKPLHEQKQTTVLITGKGTDPYIMTAGGTKIPWSDARIVKEEIEKLISR